MKISALNQYNINHKGYHQSIASTVKTGEIEFACMSFALNNVENSDLDKWISIQKKLYKLDNPTSFITMYWQNCGEEALFDVQGRELRSYNNIANFSKKEEAAVLELYTWLGDLTKRIANGEKRLFKDNGIYDKEFLNSFITTLWNKGFNKLTILGLINLSLFDKSHPHEKIAWKINKNIQKTMIKYFA